MNIRYALASILLPSLAAGFSPIAQLPHHGNTNTVLYAESKIMSDMDLMCIQNSADICSYYDECDIEEREALLNRFEQQTELLAERIATMQSLSNHLKTGDHRHLDDEEVKRLKKKVLAVAESTHVEYLDGMQAGNLQETD